MSIALNIQDIQKELQPIGVTLVAISKTKPVEDVLEAYHAGQRIFGENMVQELVEKYEQLPKDIEWHLVGHLQTNKVKYIAPFVSMIQSVDSLKLLKEIKEDFYELRMLFDGIKVSYFRKEESFDTVSMGMSSDYTIAIEQGSNMVRLGSTIFGKRVIKHFKTK